jgi:hypothetical protein
MKEFNNQMREVALESGNLPIRANKENCCIWTFNAMKRKLAEDGEIAEYLFKYIDWNHLITDHCRENAICIIQYNKETDEWEAVSSFDNDTAVVFVEYDTYS